MKHVFQLPLALVDERAASRDLRTSESEAMFTGMEQHPRSRRWRLRAVAAYVAELQQLVGREVHAQDLMSLEDTEAIRGDASRKPRVPRWKEQVTFSEREGERFGAFKAKLAALTSEPIYIWTPRTMTCGLHPPVRLGEIDFCFSFDINPEGILSFVTRDLSNELLLDFSETKKGQQTMEIEVCGESWGSARY